jgi:carbonic anhydrase/acetyltransferase-like protein (isoleucine patch superfamily)
VFTSHRGIAPTVDPTAYVAPSAVVVGDVRIGAGARVLSGAVLSAENGYVSIGVNTVVMEVALIRGREQHPAVIGDSVMIGPHAHVNGSRVGDRAFIATGASLFPGSVIGDGAEVRINAVVQVNTAVAADDIVPIGWVAVGSPAQIFSPDRHDEIWAVQRTLDFPGTVYGAVRGTSMDELMQGQSEFYGAHADDTVVDVEVAQPGNDDRLAYRLLTGTDDVSFCERVSEALRSGYQLYGSPSSTFDGERVIVAQAIVLPGTRLA